jgi:hypothetical protein
MRLTKKQTEVIKELNRAYPRWPSDKRKAAAMKKSIESLEKYRVLERCEHRKLGWQLAPEGLRVLEQIQIKEMYHNKYAHLPYPKVVQALEEAVLECGFRVCSGSSWSSSNDIRYEVGERTSVTCDSDKEWHRTKTRSCFVSTQRWVVQKNWLNIPAEIRTLGGMLTLERNQRTGKARWVRQGRGTSVVVEEGYIVDAEGVYAHGATKEKAIRAAKRQAKANARKKDGDAIYKDRREYTLRMDVHVPRDYRITLTTSLLAGNCDSGTKGWAWKNIPAAMRKGFVSYGNLRELYIAGCDQSRHVMMILKYVQRELAQKRKREVENV